MEKRKEEKKNRVKEDTRKRVERNGNQLPTKTFRYLLFRNVAFLRISADNL